MDEKVSIKNEIEQRSNKTKLRWGYAGHNVVVDAITALYSFVSLHIISIFLTNILNLPFRLQA